VLYCRDPDANELMFIEDPSIQPIEEVSVGARVRARARARVIVSMVIFIEDPSNQPTEEADQKLTRTRTTNTQPERDPKPGPELYP
jgi:hypothetical protein